MVVSARMEEKLAKGDQTCSSLKLRDDILNFKAAKFIKYIEIHTRCSEVSLYLMLSFTLSIVAIQKIDI